MKDQTSVYKDAGVDSESQDKAMVGLTDWVERSFQIRPNSVLLPLGYFANVIDLGNGHFAECHLRDEAVRTKYL